MVVSQAEIDLIENSKLRRRAMRLPVRGKCPMMRGRVYKLKASSSVQITVREVHREPLAALSQADARKEGYVTIQGALRAWEAAHGPPSEGQEVWVVLFAKGDLAAWLNQDRPIYLSKCGDYTPFASRQAVRGDPELATVPGAAERARVMAIAARQAPQARTISNILGEIETLRTSLMAMKARNRAKLIERELKKLGCELPVQGVYSETAAGQ